MSQYSVKWEKVLKRKDVHIQVDCCKLLKIYGQYILLWLLLQGKCGHFSLILYSGPVSNLGSSPGQLLVIGTEPVEHVAGVYNEKYKQEDSQCLFENNIFLNTYCDSLNYRKLSSSDIRVKKCVTQPARLFIICYQPG